MADEWNFAQTSWDGSSDTSQDLCDAIESFLTQSGWDAITSYASYAVDKRYYLYGDRATRDTWHYTGDGAVQHCGIVITDLRYNAGAFDGPQQLKIQVFLENSDGDDSQRESIDDEATILIDISTAAAHDIMMIGGEWGLHYEMGTGGIRGSVAHGMIGTHMPWSGLNGTRDAERMRVTQGICMDLFGELRFADPSNRSGRAVLDSGITDKNVTGGLSPYLVRGLDDDLHGGLVVDDVRAWGIGGIDSVFAFHDTSSTYQYVRYMKYHFGLFNNPFDDRWRISPLMFHNPMDQLNPSRYAATQSTSVSDNLAATSSGPNWFDVRNSLREVRKFAVVGHLLTPWQNITDQDSGTVYRVVRGEDGGRTFNLAVEWPGAGNEVTIP